VHCVFFFFVCVFTVRASCLLYFLELRTKSAEISHTSASVTGHLPVYLCLNVQAFTLSNFCCMWTDIFTRGSLPNCELQTVSAEISHTLASVTGHLPMYFCLKMQALALSDFYCMWTGIFTRGFLPDCVQNLIGTVNTEFDLGEQSTYLTFYSFRHRIPWLRGPW